MTNHTRRLVALLINTEISIGMDRNVKYVRNSVNVIAILDAIVVMMDGQKLIPTEVPNVFSVIKCIQE